MKQRFGIAQALLGNPKIIIADEPTAGLDPEERNRFNTLLSEIGEQVIVILSTHIVDDVKDLCSQYGHRCEGQGYPCRAARLTLIGQLEGKIWEKTISRISSGPAQVRASADLIGPSCREIKGSHLLGSRSGGRLRSSEC